MTARYIARELPPDQRKAPAFRWAIWDTKRDDWVIGGGHYATEAAAERMARMHSEAWRRSQLPSDDGA